MTRPKHGYYSHWCVLLDFHLKRRRMTAKAFAEKLGKSQQIVHAYLVGKARPPLGDISEFANALSLVNDERRQFIQAAFEAYTPQPIWRRLLELERVHPPAPDAAALKACRETVRGLVRLLRDIESFWILGKGSIDNLRSERSSLWMRIRAAINTSDIPPENGSSQ